jgi:vacuolar-type H+-ATPase subunit H
MGKKGVEEMINEIEIFIDNCKYQPLSSTKIVVPKDEMERLLSELKLKLPSEIERCKKIMRNKEAILASARTRSDAIISESVNEANRLVDTNHITELANIRANEILDAARQEADRILADANAEANEVRLGAMSYTKQKLSDMRDFFAATLEADRENYKNLVDSLENSVFTLETNMSEVDASIGLLTGVAPVQPIPEAQPNYAAPQQSYAAQKLTQAADDDDFDDDEEFDPDDEDYDDDFDDDEDEDEDDFLDE